MFTYVTLVDAVLFPGKVQARSVYGWGEGGV